MTTRLEGGRAVPAAQPFSVLLGTELSALSDAGAVRELALRGDLRQQHGFAHGGVVSDLADNAPTFAAGAVLGPALVTVEMNINCLRPAIGERLIPRIGAVRRQDVRGHALRCLRRARWLRDAVRCRAGRHRPTLNEDAGRMTGFPHGDPRRQPRLP